MPQIAIPKSSLEPREKLPAGTHQVIFGGFKPKLSKAQPGKDRTINMNPDLKIIGSSLTNPKDGKSINGSKVFTSLNLGFGPAILDFCHAFGCEMTEDGDNVQIPGSFSGDTSQASTDAQVTAWGSYSGPLLGEVATIELAEVPVDPNFNKNAKPGDTRTELKRFYCRVPGCTVNHMESLIRS